MYFKLVHPYKTKYVTDNWHPKIGHIFKRICSSMDQVLHIQQQQNQEKIPPSLTNWFVLLRSQEWERKWNSNVFHSIKTVFVSSELHNPKKIVLWRAICNVLSSDYREELLASLWITESYSVFICQCIGNMTNMNGRPKKYKRNDLPTRGRGNWDDMKNRAKKADTCNST